MLFAFVRAQLMPLAPLFSRVWIRSYGLFLNCRSFPLRSGAHNPRPYTHHLSFLCRPLSSNLMPHYSNNFFPLTPPSRKGSDFSDADSIDAAASGAADKDEDDSETSLYLPSSASSSSSSFLPPLLALLRALLAMQFDCRQLWLQLTHKHYIHVHKSCACRAGSCPRHRRTGS